MRVVCWIRQRETPLRYLTSSECAEWRGRFGIGLGADSLPASPPENVGQIYLGLPDTPGRLPWLYRFISDALKPRGECLLWVTDFGIFPSCENQHLYYRLRQSYGDHRLLREAPGHLFLEYEDADLVSFLQLGIVHGWDMHVLPDLGYGEMDTARAFVCHDEWIALHHRQDTAINEWRDTLQRAGHHHDLKMSTGEPPDGSTHG